MTLIGRTLVTAFGAPFLGRCHRRVEREAVRVGDDWRAGRKCRACEIGRAHV